jgi:hypothetical protein
MTRPPEPPPAARERSTFLQRTAEGDITGVNGWLILVSLVIGAVAGLYEWSLFVGILTALGAFVGLTVAYAVLAWFRGWPQPNWMAFIATILDFLSGW